MQEEKLIRNNKEFEIVHSTKAGVGFRNSELESLSRRYSSIRATYEKEQKTIVDEVLEVASKILIKKIQNNIQFDSVFNCVEYFKVVIPHASSSLVILCQFWMLLPALLL